MESYNSFIYLWVDNLKNRFYIGSHYGKIDDGYLFGGIDIKYEYKLRPNDFERMILSYHIVNNPSEIRLIEKEYLIRYDVENNNNFYNRTNESYGGTHKNSIEKRLKDIDENGLNAFQRASKKMVETRKNKNSYNSSKVKEYQTKKSNKSQFDEIKSKISNTLKGSRWINKDDKSLYIKSENYEEYLLNGWAFGRIYKRNKPSKYFYEECLDFIKEMNIKSSKEWYELSKLENSIPRHPNRTFKEIWVSWEHFLGKEKMIKSITYEECKSFAIKNDINSQREWQQFSKLNKLPFNPQIKYKKEWISWYLFLDKNKENNYNGSN